VAFLKFSRDKRGYEHFYLVHPSGRGKRPRVLYWFRTPPNVKVGRAPFAADIQRALEAQNPDVAFDWAAIVKTPIPPPAETERWRERRRVERALRAAGEADEAAAPVGLEEGRAEAAPAPAALVIEAPAGASAVEVAQPPAAATPEPASNVSPGGDRGRPRRRRRRRRGGRREQEVHGVQEVQQVQGVQAGQVVQEPRDPEEGV
jgi:hypothetical protein